MSPHLSLHLLSWLSPTQNELPAQTHAEAAMCDGPKDLQRSKRSTELTHVHRFYMHWLQLGKHGATQAQKSNTKADRLTPELDAVWSKQLGESD